ncbi:MAG: hypothetical protein WC421_01305 [Elusimicrobiales bacterium]
MFEALLPLVALAINAGLTAAMVERRVSPLLQAVFMGFTAGFSALLLAEIACGGAIADIAADCATYCALSYCHFHFINLGETARRIRILRELAENPGGLSPSEILARYNARSIVEARLARLARSGQIRMDGMRYKSDGMSVLLMARALDFVKKLLLGQGYRQ